MALVLLTAFFKAADELPTRKWNITIYNLTVVIRAWAWLHGNGEKIVGRIQ
jgi:hypothetical protein